MLQNKLKYRMDLRREYRSNDEIEALIETLLKKKGQEYRNKSHVIRVAIMRLYNEEHEYKRKGLISDVCKGLRERISRGNKDGKFNKKTKQKNKEAL